MELCYTNFLSWDWVLAGIILFWIMLFVLPGLYGLPHQLYNKVFMFNSMKKVEREWKNSISSIFHTEDNWNAFIEPQFVFVYKTYDSI